MCHAATTSPCGSEASSGSLASLVEAEIVCGADQAPPSRRRADLMTFFIGSPLAAHPESGHSYHAATATPRRVMVSAGPCADTLCDTDSGACHAPVGVIVAAAMSFQPACHSTRAPPAGRATSSSGPYA